MKRVLLGLAAVVGLLVVSVVALFVVTFAGASETHDGAELAGGARAIVDGHVTVFSLPIGDKELALVDCGNDPEAKAILGALQAKGLGPDAVKTIFLTHGHPDHIAGCHNFPNAQVLALAADIPIAQGEQAAKGPFPRLFGPKPQGKSVHVTRALSDGEMVQLGDLAVKVYAVPGHTAGSAAFLARGVLYLGDSAMAHKDGTLAGAPWVFSDDQAQNRASLAALSKRLVADHQDVKTLAFAHTGPLSGLQPLETFAATP